MPANLPPNYFEAEQRFREAKTPESKVEALEEMLAIMPKHKGTDKLKAMLRERISKFKDQAQKKKGTARHRTAFSIDREGAAQVAVIGAPNTGKSSLVAMLTSASPEVAEFPHTTHKPTAGMAHYENIQFQLIDTPPLTGDYIDPSFADLLRRADILAVMVDLKADPMQQLDDVFSILGGFRIFAEGSAVPADLKKTPIMKKMIVCVNKMDKPEDSADMEAFLELSGVKVPCLGISTRTGRNLQSFLDALYAMSSIIRVYTKPPGKEADKTAPFVMPVGTTIEEMGGMIHNDFVSKLKHAKIWGKAVRDGQMVQRDYTLHDGDVVEFCL